MNNPASVPEPKEMPRQRENSLRKSSVRAVLLHRPAQNRGLRRAARPASEATTHHTVDTQTD